MEASKAVASIQSIYLSQDDEMIEPLFVKVAPYIQGTLDTHYVKRSFNSNKVCFLECYRSLNDLEPFHFHCCSRVNTLVCDHVQRATKMSVLFLRNFIMRMRNGFSVLLSRHGSIKNRLENNFSVNFKDK